ncbi:hypothetical protein LXA43DRAFT_456456 [Ganoderma leucocontextum]|nr:hypothetical protein LXA43DRAFT_456456 [Ganoderma leucocontextum]
MLAVSQHYAQELNRISREVLRKSTAPPSSWQPSTPTTPESIKEPGTDTKLKKNRLSWFRSSGRRSGLILRTSLFRHSGSTPTSSPATSPTSSNEGSSSSSDSEDTRASVEVTDERSRALDILEGRGARADSDAPLARSATRTASPGDVQDNAAPGTPTTPNRPSSFTIPASFINSLPFASVIPGRSRSGSVAERRSLESRPGSALSRRSVSPTHRPSSRLDRVPEDGTIATSRVSEARERPSGEGALQEPEQDEHGLPTYASAAYPSRAVGYRFAQAGPFAMTLSAEGEEEVAGLGRYHVSVGVNVWTPRLAVTSVRRGLGEDGPLIAQIE